MLLRIEPSVRVRREPSRSALVTVRVPSDKSITQRALLLASIARGTTRVVAPLAAADPIAVRRAIEQLGARVVDVAGGLEVTGATRSNSSRRDDLVLDFANSGTGARLALGLLAGRGVAATITGDATLRARPMGRVVRPLQTMGVAFAGGDLDRLPLRINSRPPLAPFIGELEVASAQVKSALLLAALGARGESRIVERRPTRAHTEVLLARFGAPPTIVATTSATISTASSTTTPSATTIVLRGPAELAATTVHVPADPSSAAFPAAIAALSPGSSVRFEELLLSPRRDAFFGWLARAGARCERVDVADREGELVGALAVGGGELRGVDVAPAEVPDLIDELPLVAVVGALARGRTTVRGARELRFKESDRIAALSEGLTRMGARFVALEDGFVVEGLGGDASARLHGAELDARGDHRVAMAFAVAALFARGPTTIHAFECAEVSYPGFLADVAKLVGDEVTITLEP